METGRNIKSLHEDERPREKLILKGGQSLSNSELLAILIGSGNRENSALQLGRQIMDQAENQLNLLGKFSLQDFLQIKGLGPARAVTLLAAFEIGRRRKEELVVNQKSINNSRDAFNLMGERLADLPHEEMWVILLNRANNLIDKLRISAGGINATIVDPKIIFRLALERKASALIMVHNHPSGNNKPSQNDIALTNRIKEGAKILDLALIDHVIIAGNRYFSFADDGIL